MSPYAMNENRVTPADAASGGSAVGGGSIGRTATTGGSAGACWADPAGDTYDGEKDDELTHGGMLTLTPRQTSLM